MKSVLKTLFSIFESIGKVRAATHYSRMGNYEAARKVMQD